MASTGNLIRRLTNAPLVAQSSIFRPLTAVRAHTPSPYLRIRRTYASPPSSTSADSDPSSSSSTSYGSPPQTGSSSPSSSPQEADVNSSRATDAVPDQDGASLASPTSDTQSGRATGQDEEGGDPAKKDPRKPAGQKAKEVEKDGMRPLDPADK